MAIIKPIDRCAVCLNAGCEMSISGDDHRGIFRGACRGFSKGFDLGLSDFDGFCSRPFFSSAGDVVSAFFKFAPECFIVDVCE